MSFYVDMLETGKGVRRDWAEAMRCDKVSADASCHRWQAKYAIICEKGELGVPQNMEEAVRCYKMSSDERNPRGIFCYADMLEDWKRVIANMDETARLYQLAADQGYARAIAHIVYTGKGVPQNPKRGRELMESAR
jgi:TPR repeat protein